MMNMKQMLGKVGRTISNRDMQLAQQMMGMSDNEPMMQDRSPENQIFSINAQIENLKKSYNMLVNAQEFDRAQEVANQINMLDVQKTQIQAQNVPQQDQISSLLESISI